MKYFIGLLLMAPCLTVCGQAEYCLDGTQWSDSLNGCVPAENVCFLTSDLNGDGNVGSTDLLVILGEFGMSFPDGDGDGICDAEDPCVGIIDECGVCNGEGPTVQVIEEIEIFYDSLYAEQIDQWLVFEVGADTTFSFICGPGCTDPLADNYLPSATSDDGSCIYLGCTNPLSPNFNPLSNVNDGSCELTLCAQNNKSFLTVVNYTACTPDIFVNDSLVADLGATFIVDVPGGSTTVELDEGEYTIRAELPFITLCTERDTVINTICGGVYLWEFR
jgi:hypothetical protein